MLSLVHLLSCCYFIVLLSRAAPAMLIVTILFPNPQITTRMMMEVAESDTFCSFQCIKMVFSISKILLTAFCFLVLEPSKSKYTTRNLPVK